MRVQEGKPSVKTAIMGKKKHKLRKQAKDNEMCPSDSSDDGGNAGRCPHLSKAINFNTMRKALKQLGTIGECVHCDKKSTSHMTESRPEEAVAGATGGNGDVIMDEKLFDDPEPTIWVCLQCGNQGCDRNSKDQHALKHFQTPRSNLHSVVINLNTWAIWCYSCDDEVSPDSSRKLQECTEFLRKMVGSSSASGPGSSTVNRAGSFKSESQPSADGAGCTDVSSNIDSMPAKPKPISLQTAASVTQGLPKVKGLSNLGNTCFFNAVMQNLSQTSVLETLLLDRGIKGAGLNLPGRKADSDQDEAITDSSSGSDDDMDDRKVELPSCTFTTAEPGALTQSLVSFMRDMHNPSKMGTISPNNLFGQVCKKAPRFKGFQQQDSHELLRHLLDGMKAEEIKRSQAAILKHFHLPENVNPKKVDEDTKTKVKEYGRQAKHTFVDGVFGGVFISTVQCEECHVPSQVFEPFLDISLPILEEKTVRPNNMWSWRKKEEPERDKTSAMDELMVASDKGGSKHQQKKAKRQAKKESKRKPRTAKSAGAEDGDKAEGEDGADKSTDGAKTSDLSKAQGDSRSQSDGEISDADVEDNIESDFSRNRFSHLTSRDDLHRTDSSPPPPGPSPPPPQSSSPTPESSGPARVCNLPAESSASCSSLSSMSASTTNVDRCDSTGRSEESTLTETSAAESLRSANSVQSLSDSTCKASSGADSPFGSHSALNKPDNGVTDITDGLKKLDMDDAKNKLKNVRDSSKDSSKKSDLGSAGSVDGTEENISTSNGTHCTPRSRSSGYSSGNTSKANSAASASSGTNSVCSRAQLRLDAKFKAMSSLAQRYQPISQECSVRSCLNQFTSAELLTGSNKFGCETCTKRKHGNSGKDGKKDTIYTNASKQVLLFQPPAILTLHLKRFQQVGFTLRKVNRHVEFPMMLDIAPYCSSLSKGVRPGQSKVLYALYGVVEHSGRLTGGHYTAYVKVRPNSTRIRDFLHSQDSRSRSVDRLLEFLHSSHQDHAGSEQGHDPEVTEVTAPPPGKWFYISDSRVTEVNEASVLRCQAYLLFYERIL